MSIARELVRLGMGMEGTGIPPGAYQAATRLLIDTIGCAIAGWREPGIQPVREGIRAMGSMGPAHALVYGDALRPDDAVLLNGTMAHALDLDDTHCPAVLHLMCKLLPTALAVGEVQDASGRAVVEAVIAGMEIAGRIGRNFRNFPFLNSNVAGIFGVTYAACRLMRLSEQQAVDAFGIAYSQICGTRQALLEATMGKRIQPAFAGRAAVWAAALAKNGFTGPEEVFEGDAGLFQAFARGAACPPPEAFLSPRERLEVEEDSIKSYPTCGAHHGAIQAAKIIRAEHAYEYGDIDRVDLYLMGAQRMVGAPFQLGRNPQINAQFSAAYAVALALLKGEPVLEDFRDEAIRANAQVADLACRTRVHGEYDGALAPTYPRGTMRIVRLRLKDGRVIERAMPNNESSLYPERLTDADVKRKFRDCCAYSGICPPDKAASILEAIATLTARKSVRAFVKDHLILLEEKE